MIDLMLFRHSETEDFPAEQIIFKVGEAGNTMYVIAEGEVSILVGATVVEVAGPGTIVGEMALIDLGPRSATAVAKTDCKLVPIDQRPLRIHGAADAVLLAHRDEDHGGPPAPNRCAPGVFVALIAR
jgi:CRP-like cAMP-binding protein